MALIQLQGKTIEVHSSRVIGRGDLDTRDVQVSRSQLLFEYQDGLYVTRLGPNPCNLNGKLLEKDVKTIVNDDDIVTCKLDEYPIKIISAKGNHEHFKQDYVDFDDESDYVVGSGNDLPDDE